LIAAGANVTHESRGLLSELSKEYAQTDSKPWLKRQLVLPIGIVDMQTAHIKYLRSRGFNPQKIKKLWGVQGFCVHKDLSWRLFIPIEYKGEVVSWTTRSLGENRRYISASEYQERIPHKELLYGEHYVRNSVVVLEGITDVWKVGPGAVALFGTGFKRSQVLKISKYPKRVICFDSEKKAQEKAEELACMLQSFPGETIVVQLQTGKDPCSASDKEVKQLRSFLK
jgi:DNA primase